MIIEGDKKDTTINYAEKINEINSKIIELSDNETENDASVKESLNSTLNSEFLKKFVIYLDEDGNSDKKKNLINSIKLLLDSHKSDENWKTEYKVLFDLAKALGIDGYNDKLDGGDGNNSELSVTLDLKQPDKLLDGQVSSGKFYKGIDQSEGTQSPLESAKTDIQDQINKIINLTNDENKTKLTEGHKLGEVNTLLENFIVIIGNPTVSNVQMLQEYIFNNLGEEEKQEFKISNKYNESTGKFDGKFGISTLNGLNSVLGKTKKYIDSFEQTESQGAGELQVKSDVELVLGGGEVDPSTWFNNLPADAKVSFVSDAEKAKLSQVGDQAIKINVETGGQTREITVKVKVVNKSTSGGSDLVSDHPPVSTEPLSLQVDGKDQRYQVMQNTSTLSSRLGLSGATFYSTDAFSGNQPVDGQKWETISAPMGRDYECYVRLNNKPNEIYKISVDKFGNVCPVLKNVRDKGGILLKNNDSCKRYLANKLPDCIKRSCVIGWSEKEQDYVLASYGKCLTIEPMTVAGDWISKDLGQCLAFINFTNFLRCGGAINGVKLKGKDPDLKIDDNKLKVRVEKNSNGGKKWYDVPLDVFGLGNDSNTLKKFIDYNNHEDWWDEWDKKKANRNYTKLDAQVSVSIHGSGNGNPDSSTGGNGNPDSSTGGNGNPDSPTGGNGTPDSSTGGNGTPDSPTGGNGTPDSSTGGNGTPDSSTGGNGNPDSSTGGNGTPDSSTGGNGNPDSSTGGNENPDSSTGGNENPDSSTGGNGTPDSPTGGNENPDNPTGGNDISDLWKMKDKNFDDMKDRLGDEKMFILKDGDKVVYDFVKLKAYLEGLTELSWRDLNAKEGIAWISAVQIMLNKNNGAGEKLIIDGIRGKKTIARVREFQGQVGITVDGAPGKETIKKLLSEIGTVDDGGAGESGENSQPGQQGAEQQTNSHENSIIKTKLNVFDISNPELDFSELNSLSENDANQILKGIKDKLGAQTLKKPLVLKMNGLANMEESVAKKLSSFEGKIMIDKILNSIDFDNCSSEIALLKNLVPESNTKIKLVAPTKVIYDKLKEKGVSNVEDGSTK